MKNEVNKILEIDVDTCRRDIPLQITQIKHSTRPRTREPDTEIDLGDNLTILANALLCTIKGSEANGFCRKGEGMARALGILGNGYADDTILVTPRNVIPETVAKLGQ